MRILRVDELNESAVGPGWVEMAAPEWRYGLGVDRRPENWTVIEYKAGPHAGAPADSNLKLTPPMMIVRAGQRSWLEPRIARMVVDRLHPLGVVDLVAPFVRGMLEFPVGVASIGEPADPDEAPVDMPGVDPRSFGDVIDAAGGMGLGMGLEVRTRRMMYQFWADEDDYFWVSSSLRTPFSSADEAHRYDILRHYRADQLGGLESLLGQLLRSGADWVPAGALGLAAGDIVEHEKFGVARVLSATGGRCRLWFAEPFRTMDGKVRQEVEFSAEKARLRVVPQT